MSTLLENTVALAREAVNYASIMKYKRLLNEKRPRGDKLSINDFIALSPGNDPFYAGKKGGVIWGRWFAEMWQEHKGHTGSVHVRGLHYALVGKTNSDNPVIMPNGKVYENTEKCWKKLEMAGRFARHNHYIDAEKFEDRRAQSLYERVYDDPFTYIGMTSPEIEFAFPAFPSRPEYTLYYENKQRYRLEVWCEKSTQEEILKPIAEKYRVTMLSAQGELSISAMLKAIARAEKSGMPTRILYISDFDPAGRSMPVAASRKLEFWQSVKRSQADIQLYPIALTHEQCVYYRLERTPIKDTERRKAKFEERYGGGATELDALEAAHPGELANLLEREILKYYDETLETRTQEMKAWLAETLLNTQERVYNYHEEEYNALIDEYTELREEFNQWVERRCLPFQQRLEKVWQGIKKDMIEEKPDLNLFALPLAKEVPAGESCLYDSSRGYFQQLTAYRAFTGKFAHLIKDEDEEDEETA